MAAALESSFNLNEVILDLDELRNLAHPCWEILQPIDLATINKLATRFDGIFFEGILKQRSIGLKIMGESAGETVLSAGTNRERSSTIYLNKEMGPALLRKEVIETLLHEQIHSYLMRKKMEDSREKGFHGPNFDRKANEINSVTGLNIASHHNYIPVNRRQKTASIEKAKRYIWRCRNFCRNMALYFGFVWLNEKCAPNKTHPMCTNNDICDHSFERYGDAGDPKDHLTEWECIIKFNEFIVENGIQIKTKEIHSIHNRYFKIAPSSYEPFTDVHHDYCTPPAILNKFYMNFDDDTKTFLSVHLLDSDLYKTTEASRTVCLICFEAIVEETIAMVIRHLKRCTGLDLSLDDHEQLPILKIIKE